MTTTSQRKERRDRISLGISAASLALGVAGLLLNEKPQEIREMPIEQDKGKELAPAMTKKELAKQKKNLKNQYKAQIQADAVKIGYPGTVMVFNREGKEVAYRLVPLEEKPVGRKPPSKSCNRASSTRSRAYSSRQRTGAPAAKSWVAMEINARDGTGTVAVTCDSKEDAAQMCRKFARSHKTGSTPGKYCIQRYAYLDTSKPIDVENILLGDSSIKTYGV